MGRWQFGEIVLVMVLAEKYELFVSNYNRDVEAYLGRLAIVHREYIRIGIGNISDFDSNKSAWALTKLFTKSFSNATLHKTSHVEAIRSTCRQYLENPDTHPYDREYPLIWGMMINHNASTSLLSYLASYQFEASKFRPGIGMRRIVNDQFPIHPFKQMDESVLLYKLGINGPSTARYEDQLDQEIVNLLVSDGDDVEDIVDFDETNAYIQI